MYNVQPHPKFPLTQSLVWVGLSVCLFYWFLESLIHVVIFNESDLISSIFTPDPHELWKRFLVISLIFVFGIYAQRSINLRTNTEEALALALGEMDQIFQTASVGMRVIDRNYNVLKINKTFEKITRVSASEAVGRKCHMIFAGPMCFTPECPLTLILKRQQSVECHVEKKRLDGSTVPCILTATPFISSDGNFIGIVESFKDITELEKVKEAIRRKRDKLQSILSHMKEGVSIINREYIIEFQNNTHKKFIGEQEAGVPCYRAFKNLDAPCDPCLMHEAISTGDTRLIEFDTPLGDSFEQTYTPIIDIDGRQKALVQLRDVTSEKNAIAAMMEAQQLAAIGELAAGVAHEINNPINGVINYAQILINKYSDHSLIEDISSRVIKEGNRIARIVERLLFFSRHRNEEKNLTLINEVLYDSLTLTASQLRKDNIILNTDIPDDLPLVLAQAHEIEQVFINLISNARDSLNLKYPEANDNKVLEITARTVNSTYPPKVEISFRDHGIGIPSDLYDKVLNPFFSTKKGRMSMGLGLSISHGIIDDHGGVLHIDSIENIYTNITVNLPIH